MYSVISKHHNKVSSYTAADTIYDQYSPMMTFCSDKPAEHRNSRHKFGSIVICIVSPPLYLIRILLQTFPLRTHLDMTFMFISCCCNVVLSPGQGSFKSCFLHIKSIKLLRLSPTNTQCKTIYNYTQISQRFHVEPMINRFLVVHSRLPALVMLVVHSYTLVTVAMLVFLIHVGYRRQWFPWSYCMVLYMHTPLCKLHGTTQQVTESQSEASMSFWKLRLSYWNTLWQFH